MLFKRETGMSFTAFYRHMRMRRARELLAEKSRVLNSMSDWNGALGGKLVMRDFVKFHDNYFHKGSLPDPYYGGITESMYWSGECLPGECANACEAGCIWPQAPFRLVVFIDHDKLVNYARQHNLNALAFYRLIAAHEIGHVLSFQDTTSSPCQSVMYFDAGVSFRQCNSYFEPTGCDASKANQVYGVTRWQGWDTCAGAGQWLP